MNLAEKSVASVSVLAGSEMVCTLVDMVGDVAIVAVAHGSTMVSVVVAVLVVLIFLAPLTSPWMVIV